MHGYAAEALPNLALPHLKVFDRINQRFEIPAHDPWLGPPILHREHRGGHLCDPEASQRGMTRKREF